MCVGREQIPYAFENLRNAEVQRGNPE